MFRALMTVLCLAALPALPSPARADGADMIRFLESTEGHWLGSGTIREIAWDGFSTVTFYSHSMDVRFLHGDQWQVLNNRRFPTGAFQNSTYQYAVTGESLWIGYPTPNESAEVTESTAQSLVYRLFRADPRTGRVYRYTYDLRLSPAGDGRTAFLGHGVVDWNGVIVSDDSFRLDR